MQKSLKLQKLESLVKKASIYSKFLAEKLQDQHTFKVQPKLVTGCDMRDYQLEGVEWLIGLYQNGLNGILADEMGLGKTLQTIAFLAYLKQVKSPGPFLVVAPLSTISNWQNEFNRFAPSIKTCLYHGKPKDRTQIRKNEFLDDFVSEKFPVIITSYEIIIQDTRYLKKIPWKFIIVDEGHRLKNMNCELIQRLRSFSSANRLLLTGTPLQNNLKELWSLLNFLMPLIFDDLSAFEEWFEFDGFEQAEKEETEGSKEMIKSLHEILSPFLLRRIKADVLKNELPPKKEYLVFAQMTEKQQVLYDAILNNQLTEYLLAHIRWTFGAEIENESGTVAKKRRVSNTIVYTEKEENDEFVQEAKHNYQLNKKDERSRLNWIKTFMGKQNLQNTVMQLRKVCNHPYLFHIDPVEEDGTVLEWSGKMLLLDKILNRLLPNGHSVVIFSQMTAMLDVLEDYLVRHRKLKICRIDGGVGMADRQEQLHGFSNDPDLRIFLVSTRAGGLGINLTKADTVIIFDSDWNPQVDLQAQDRVHRIGQTKPVLVLRFVSANTVEESILQTAQSKRALEKLVIHKSKFKGKKSLGEDDGLKDLEQLLEEARATKIAGVTRAYDEPDLDKLLERSTSSFSDDYSVRGARAVGSSKSLL